MFLASNPLYYFILFFQGMQNAVHSADAQTPNFVLILAKGVSLSQPKLNTA